MAGNPSARAGALILTAAVLLDGGGPPARADDAAALLKRGSADMKAGDYEKACPALAQSYKLAPTPVSAFQSATCEANAGRFKTAVDRYAHVLELVEALPARDRKQHKDRVDVATKQRADLAPYIPTITVSLAEGAPSTTIVKCDGVPIERAQLGVPLPFDPGEHVFTTQVPPSGPVRERRMTLTASDKLVVNLLFDLPPAEPSAPPAPASAEPEPDQPTAPPPVESSGLRRPLAYGALALGILGVAAGAVTGILSMQKKSVVDESCDGEVCSGAGKAAADDGLLLAHLSTIGFGIGVAGLATGVVLIVTEPSAAEAQARAPGPAPRWRGVKVGVAGRW